MKKYSSKKMQFIMIGIVMLISLGITFFFGTKKMGYHEDEYYSYYSTCFSQGWTVPDGEWADMNQYSKEFMVLSGEKYQYSLVKTIQSWDVHPPMYYWLLHTVCSLTPNRFDKWQGIGLNMVAYLLSILFFYLCVGKLWEEQDEIGIPILVTMLYAWTPGLISGVMFVRMYSVLSLWVLVAVYFHLCAWKSHQMSKWYWLVAMLLITYIGFLTHYYYMIFQFFLTGSCCIFLFWSKKWKEAFLYGATILLGILLGILTYPCCLGQMFHGQRGAEATTNFFDLKNTLERLITFLKLANRFWFGGFGILLCLVFIIMLVSCSRKKQRGREVELILWITFWGYFFAVSKTALLLGDSSIRYILPILGTVLLAMISSVAKYLTTDEKNKKCIWLIYLVIVCIFIGNIVGIAGGKILFLYPEDVEKVDFARTHKDTPVVYIYAQEESWKAWESTNELLEYDRVFFVSDGSTEEIQDETLVNADEIIIYVQGNVDFETQCQRFSYAQEKCILVQEEKFCNVYQFEK